jgi:hypothetical protein
VGAWTGCTVDRLGGLTLLRSTTFMFGDRVAPPLPTAGRFALPNNLNGQMSATPYYAKQVRARSSGGGRGRIIRRTHARAHAPRRPRPPFAPRPAPTRPAPPHRSLQVVWNAAGTRFWVAVPTSASVTDGGVYSGTALTTATIIVAATYRVTGIALSADGATVFFAARAPQHAVYSFAATCTSACVPALVYAAPSGTELRGLSLAPQPPPAASPSASPAPSLSASATPTPSRTPSSSPWATQPAAPALAFAASSVVVLRVGDGAAALTNSTAPLFLDEYGPGGGPNGTTWAMLQSVAVSGVTLSGTDYTQGAFSRAADGSSLALAGVAAPAGAAPLTAAPWFPFDRVIASFDRSGTAALTPIAAAAYDGLVKGVCSFDGSGFWVLGNCSAATPIGIGFIARGAAPTAITDVTSLAAESFTACAATFGGGLIVARSQASTRTVFQDFAADSAAGGPLTLVAGTAAFGTGVLTGQPSYAKAIVTTLDGSRSWLAAVANIAGVLGRPVDGGIYVGRPEARSAYTLAVALVYKVTGLALSPTETTLYFTARAPLHALYSASATCNTGCAVTLVAQAAANTEFRGLAPAPQPFAPLPSATPSPAASPLPLCAPNFFRVNGTCAACAAGTTSAGGAAVACARCAPGTSSAAGSPCVACAAGTFAAGNAAACSPCAANTFSAAGAAACAACPTTAAYFSLGALAQPGQSSCACAQGFGWSSATPAAGAASACSACGAGSSNAANGTTACVCSAAGTTWSAAGNACRCNAGTTSRGTIGAELVCSPCATTCAAGTFASGPCTGTANTVCAPCAANSYAAAGDAACTACGAGSSPDAMRARCICDDPNSVWSRATNTCACAYGYSGAPCAVDPTAVTQTPTPSATGSRTSSATPTPTPSISTGASLSVTPSATSTVSITPTPSRSPSNTASNSRTPSASPSAASATPSGSATTATTRNPSPSGGASSGSATPSVSRSASPSPSPTASNGASLGLAAGSPSGASGASSSTLPVAIAAVAAVAVVAGAAFFIVRQRRAGGAAAGGRAIVSQGQRAAVAGASWGARGGRREEADDKMIDSSSPIFVAGAGAAALAAERARRSSFAPHAAGGAASASGASPAVTSWTRCTRLSTGQVYFYNGSTGETVWSLPVGGCVVAEMSQ